MARTKKANDIPLQLNLSTKRLFDAHLILAISDYRNDKKNKITKLLKSLIDKAIEEDDRYPRFSSLEFDESIEFPSYFPEKLRVVVVISDEKQKEFLTEVQGKMNLTDYVRYLFLKHFYGAKGKKDGSALVGKSLSKERARITNQISAGLSGEAPAKKQKLVHRKPIIEPVEYVKKDVEVSKKTNSRTNFGSDWIS